MALLALLTTAYSAFTSHQSLLLSQQYEQVSLFNEFQNEYATISGRFPPQLLNPDFRPAPGTEEYERLQAYWIFAYAEWFATNQLGNGVNQSLWTHYYAPLVLNAMEIPSLHYVLTDMQQSYGKRRPTMQQFYRTLQELAREAGEPLQPAALVHHP